MSIFFFFFPLLHLIHSLAHLFPLPPSMAAAEEARPRPRRRPDRVEAELARDCTKVERQRPRWQLQRPAEPRAQSRGGGVARFTEQRWCGGVSASLGRWCRGCSTRGGGASRRSGNGVRARGEARRRRRSGQRAEEERVARQWRLCRPPRSRARGLRPCARSPMWRGGSRAE